MKKDASLSNSLKKMLKLLPKEAGVYRFYDIDKNLLYIGKAICLRNRVKSYFQNDANQGAKTKKLTEKIESIECTVTKNEVEALVLEANLIHKYKPPFNILLRDDKHFLYLKITKEPFPRVLFTRAFERDGSTYFGPYAKATPLRKTVDFLREILQFRTCKVEISPEGKTVGNPENRKIPCLDYQIRRCKAPCDKRMTSEEYNKDIRDLVQFLRGHTREIKKRLKEKMIFLAEKKEFEKAARFRDLLGFTETLEMSQVAEVSQSFSADVIGASFGVEKSFFHVLYLRNGKILRSENFSLANGENDEETFQAFLREHILLSAEIPPLLLVPDIFSETDSSLWESFAESLSSQKTEIHFPKRGVKKSLLEMAQKNANLQAVNSRASFEKKDVLHLLQTSLGLSDRPERIECYDISHLSGTHTVGSQVVFLEGKPAKSEYRKYKIKTLLEGKIDDFSAMAEVIGRRLKHIQDDTHILESREIETKREKKSVQKKIESDIKTDMLWEFTDAHSGKIVGYAGIHTKGKLSLLSFPYILPDFDKESLSIEILRKIALESSEKSLRLLFSKKKLRFKLALISAGFQEEKKIPKILEKEIFSDIEKNEIKNIVLKISPTEVRKKSKRMPNLLVIDGGKGQLSAVIKVLKKLDLLKKIPVCSLAKREEEIFVPGKSTPLFIPKNSPENQLLQNIRDEAHRFAIGFNKQLRKKSETASVLDEISGVSEKIKKELLKKFRSPNEIFLAEDEELLTIVSKKVLKNIRNHRG